MKIKELIEILKNLDQETEVLVDGYEYGYDNLLVKQVFAEKETNPPRWGGDFEFSKEKNATNVVVIGRSWDHLKEELIHIGDHAEQKIKNLEEEIASEQRIAKSYSKQKEEYEQRHYKFYLEEIESLKIRLQKLKESLR